MKLIQDSIKYVLLSRLNGTMKLHTGSFIASQDDCNKMSDAYIGRNEVESVLNSLFQAFSNSIYLQQDSELNG